jgi:hypothetical protein
VVSQPLPASLPDLDIPFDCRREQECQAQRPLRGQIQVSPASLVTELNAIVRVALEPADDDAPSPHYRRTLVCQHAASSVWPSSMCCTFPRTRASGQGDCAGRLPAIRSAQIGPGTRPRHGAEGVAKIKDLYRWA